ncbi:MAG: lipoyl synthase [Actinomycetaceae bacterium]|nr:lipoyl synthase [Actinomycetaceae bacterium]
MSTIPEVAGRKLLRVEVRNAQTPIEKKPKWIRTQAKAGDRYLNMRERVIKAGSHTVCAEAGCPNIFECWEDREATFLIGGALCTRRCDFCDIATGRPTEYDQDEPRRVASEIAHLGLHYATITGVSRDDLPDGASWLYAETCRQIRAQSPGTGVELLVDDFRADPDALAQVFDSAPEVFGHNLETVPRIFKKIRPAFRYDRSLQVLQAAHEAGLITKSNLILGMGETRAEIEDALRDMRSTGVDLLTITQYLRPSAHHHPIDRWVKPGEFVELSKMAYSLGFVGVMSGPLVRSSYRAGRLWAKAMRAKGQAIPPHLAHLAQEGPARQEASALIKSHPEFATA